MKAGAKRKEDTMRKERKGSRKRNRYRERIARKEVAMDVDME